MPVDKNGVRADIIMDPSSTISRMNVGRLYEAYIGSSSRIVKKHVTDELKRQHGEISNRNLIKKTSDDDLKKLFNYVLEYLSIFNNLQFKQYSYIKNDVRIVSEILLEVLNNELYVFMPIDNENDAATITDVISNSKFTPLKDKITYNINGVKKTSEDDISIVPMYIILLSKLGDTWLSTSSSKVNHFGIPIGLSKVNKYRVPWSDNPTKNISETEGRLFAGYAGRTALAELKDRANSMNTHKHIYRNILKSDIPSNIDNIVDRKVVPYGGDDSLNLVDSILLSGGCCISFVEEKR